MSRTPPWRRLHERCCRCDALATRQVRADGIESPSCELHYEALMDAGVDEHGSAAGSNIRDSWRFWLLHRFWLGRPIGMLSVAIYNWRMERGFEGKRFGRQMEAHDLGDGLVLVVPEDQ